MKRRFVPRAVVFDLDGTLINSMPLVLLAIGHALEPFGSREDYEILAHLGGPPERFLATLLKNSEHVPVALQRMNDFHERNARMIRPFDGISAILAQLQLRVPLGLWTGRDRHSTLRLLAEHGMADYFLAAVCGDDLPTHKPDPEGLKQIMQRLGVTPEETLLVGDADADVLGGSACGVNTLLIQNGRRVDGAVAARAWQTVEHAEAAMSAVFTCLG